MEGPLAGVRILDLGRLLPGPYATRVLAELGADVVKVEDPAGGDYARWYPPLDGDPPMSGIFRTLNRGKRSVALDLRTEDGRRAFEALLDRSDVLFDTFRPDVLPRLGLDPARLLADRPRLVYCALSGFGRTGPDRLRAGHDLGFLARAGGLGGSAGGPVVPPVQVADLGGALSAVAGVLAALFARERTGRGQVVDASLLEGALPFSTTAFGLLVAGHRRQPGAELLDGSRPAYSVYGTKDGRQLAVAALEPKFWAAFLRVIGRPDLEASGLDGGEAGAKVKAEVGAVLARRTLAEWLDAFAGVDACVEPVAELEEVLADPQLVARASARGGELGGPIRVAEAVVAFEHPAAGAPPPLPDAPGLGAHTAELLEEAGVDAVTTERILSQLSS